MDCVQGICNEADGSCSCNPGWEKDVNGNCTVQNLCYNKDCENGSCNPADGSCDCEPGWELGAVSNKCDVEMRAKFIGTWRATDCGASTPHNIIIYPSVDLTKVVISNYANAFCAGSDLIAVGTLSSDGSRIEYFTSDCASVGISSYSNVIIMNASGIAMTCTYNVTIGGTTYNCTLTYIKQ